MSPARRLFAIAVITSTLLGCSEASGPTDRPGAARLVREAASLADAGSVSQAMDRLAAAKAKDPKNPEVYLLRARLLTQDAHVRQAQDELLGAHKVLPDHPEITMALLRSEVDSMPPQQTEALARLAVTQNPESAEALLRLGRILKLEGGPPRYSEALQDLEGAHRIEELNPEPVTEMADIHLRMGQYDRALVDLATAAALLDEAARHPGMPSDVLEGWVDQRQMNASLAASCYTVTHRTAQARAARHVEAKWSAASSLLRRLQERAAAIPPDIAARAQLDEVSRLGPAYWDRTP